MNFVTRTRVRERPLRRVIFGENRNERRRKKNHPRVRRVRILFLYRIYLLIISEGREMKSEKKNKNERLYNIYTWKQLTITRDRQTKASGYAIIIIMILRFSRILWKLNRARLSTLQRSGFIFLFIFSTLHRYTVTAAGVYRVSHVGLLRSGHVIVRDFPPVRSRYRHAVIPYTRQTYNMGTNIFEI